MNLLDKLTLEADLQQQVKQQSRHKWVVRGSTNDAGALGSITNQAICAAVMVLEAAPSQVHLQARQVVADFCAQLAQLLPAIPQVRHHAGLLLGHSDLQQVHHTCWVEWTANSLSAVAQCLMLAPSLQHVSQAAAANKLCDAA
jgi:hypothetical protein